MNKLHFLILSLFLLTHCGFTQNAALHFNIKDVSTNALTPAKIVILKDGEPFEHKVASTKDLACRAHTIYARTGTGQFTIPAGIYDFYIGKGMEYSVERLFVKLEKGQRFNLSATLRKELDTEGLIGGDMHLHTYTYSGHGDATVEERLISCAGEGLDWIVATDHNEVLDYKPFLKKLELDHLMASAIGNEVSTPIGHFNTYPLPNGSAPINSDISIGKDLFDSIKKQGTDNTLVQVNHPRWIKTDFFNTKGLDPYFGKSKHPEWDGGFDAIEVLNENGGIGWRDAPDNLHSVRQDWYNLLNRGKRTTGLGNSDSHSVIAQIAGVPRNYIVSSTDTPTDISEAELIRNIKEQKVIVAAGLLPTIIANKNYGVGDQLTLQDGQLLLQLQVQAPSWVSCHKVELIENGVAIKTFDVPPSNKTIRFDSLVVLHPKMDSWYSLVARGDMSMEPMVQSKEKPVYPVGFTNPIWVDVDGDHQITSVDENSRLLVDSMHNNTSFLLARLQQRPAMIIPAFQHLFEKYPIKAVPFTSLFLKLASSRQRLLLYRELAKIGSVRATSILTNEKRKDLLPLEEVVLNYYLAFPIKENKVAKFKKKENTDLDEQLNWLEDVFRYNYSGATTSTVKIAKGNRQASLDKLDWQTLETTNTSFLPLNKLSDKNGSHYYIHYPLFAKMDTLFSFYINTNAPVKVSRDGNIIQTILFNNQFPIEGKMVQLPLVKGKNDLYFQVQAIPNNRVAIQEINPDKLIDPLLATVHTVKHVALDKAINYQTEYVSRYHGHGIALTDGYRGTTDIQSQLWQGWNGEEAAFTIDLGTVQTIQKVSLGILINQDSWIFAPASISCSFSKDGVIFTQENLVTIDATTKQSTAQTQDVVISDQTINTRYIRVIANKLDAIPDWHKGKGGAAWIALDELIVE